MKTLTIVSGNFATSDKNKGNFTGYTALGERIFIHKNMVESVGIKTNDDFKKLGKLFAVVAEREFDVVDANNQATGEKFSRTQALSIFTKIEEISDAVNADFKLQVTITKDRSAIAKSAELDDEIINKLITASLF
jgi:hypothetical protein